MITIAQISDTHFGTEIPSVVNSLQLFLIEKNPDFILLSGDITQRARRSQFHEARKFLEGTGKPYFTIPGNHDLPLFDLLSRLVCPYRLYSKFFGPREFIHVQENIALVGLDATGPERHKMGKLGIPQVTKTLVAARERIGPQGLLLVTVHQPLLTAWAEDRTEELLGERSIATLFSEHKVDAVISGHVHVPLICTSDKAYPTLTHRFIHIGAGTATSYRTREGKPNSFNMIKVDAARSSLEVAQYDYLPLAGTFSLVQEMKFAKEPDGLWIVK